MLRPLTDTHSEIHTIVRSYYERVPRQRILIPVVALIECLKGHVNVLGRDEALHMVVKKYSIFGDYYAFLRSHDIAQFDGEAASIYESLSGSGGVQDRRIAAIALRHRCKVVTRNVEHFLSAGLPPEFVVNWTVKEEFLTDDIRTY